MRKIHRPPHLLDAAVNLCILHRDVLVIGQNGNGVIDVAQTPGFMTSRLTEPLQLGGLKGHKLGLFASIECEVTVDGPQIRKEKDPGI